MVVGCVFWLSSRIIRAHSDRATLTRPAVVLVGLVVVQVLLGAGVVWTGKAVAVTTLHVVVGAAILATAVVIVMRTWRLFEASRSGVLVDTTLGVPQETAV